MTSDTDKKTIKVAQYLFERIAQLGVSSIFGCPGDFNLNLLDFVYTVPSLKWVGCCNELNAAYAADGYGRISTRPGVLITTYGVGELSAMNGISGAFAEQSPILHIVGVTGRPIQEKHLLIHHVRPSENALDPPDHSVYEDMSKDIRVAHELLYSNDEEVLCAQIDRVIEEVVKKSRPGYIHIPVDVVFLDVSRSRLDKPLNLEIHNPDATQEDALVDEIVSSIVAAKSPAILADTLAERHRARDLTRRLAAITQFKSYTTLLGKGIIDETAPNYVGLYNGKLSLPGVAESIEKGSDLVLNIGPLLSDSNTGGFTREIDDEKLIILHPDYVQIKGKVYKGYHLLPTMEKLLAAVSQVQDKLAHEDVAAVKATIGTGPAAKVDYELPEEYFVEKLSEMLQEGDTVIAETGTFQFAVPDVKFKSHSKFITQVFYSSIGFALPAAFGAGMSKVDFPESCPGRIVLIEGDGSAQMTIQELGSMVRHNLPIIVFLLNNEGYSIERAIWGPKQGYNDICPNWKWTQLCSAFGGEEGVTVKNKIVKTKADLDALVKDTEFFAGEGVRFVEVVVDKYDYPWRLNAQIERMGAYNRKLFSEYVPKK